MKKSIFIAMSVLALSSVSFGMEVVESKVSQLTEEQKTARKEVMEKMMRGSPAEVQEMREKMKDPEFRKKIGLPVKN